MTINQLLRHGYLVRTFGNSKIDQAARYLRSIGELRKQKPGPGNDLEATPREAAALLIILMGCETNREMTEFGQTYLFNIRHTELSNLSAIHVFQNFLSDPKRALKVRRIRVSRQRPEIEITYIDQSTDHIKWKSAIDGDQFESYWEINRGQLWDLADALTGEYIEKGELLE